MAELWLILFGSNGILKSRPIFIIVMKFIYLVVVLPFIVLGLGFTGFSSSRIHPSKAKIIIVNASAIIWGLMMWAVVYKCLK